MTVDSDYADLSKDVASLKALISQASWENQFIHDSCNIGATEGSEISYIEIIKTFNDSLQQEIDEVEEKPQNEYEKEKTELESDLNLLKSFTRTDLEEPIPSQYFDVDKFMRKDSAWSSYSFEDNFSADVYSYNAADQYHNEEEDFHQMMGRDSLFPEESLDPISLSEDDRLLRLNANYQRIIVDRLNFIHQLSDKNKVLEKRALALISLMSKREFDSRKTFSSYFINENGETPSESQSAIKLKERQSKLLKIAKSLKWTEKEKFVLAKGIRQENQRILTDDLIKSFEGESSKEVLDLETLQSIQKGIEEIRRLPSSKLEMNMVSLDWDKIANNYVPSRSPIECKIQWTVNDHPLINKTEWSKYECSKLLEIVERRKEHCWQAIAEELGTNRTAAQCIIQYQRKLNKNLLKSRWSEDEDKVLKQAVAIYGEKSWQSVASCLEGRTGQQCLHRWQKALHPNIKHGRWTKEEDEALVAAVKLHGNRNWFKVKSYVKGRTDVQCRERWANVLDPSLNMGPWTVEEDEKLEAIVSTLGLGKWSQVAAEMTSRTDNQCWRRWKSLHSEDHKLDRRNRKRKVEVCKVEKPAFAPEEIVDTYVVENYKFNDARMGEDDSESTSSGGKKKARFPRHKFKAYLEHFQVAHPVLNPNPQSKRNIPTITAEASTAKAFEKLARAVGSSEPSPPLTEQELQSEAFQALKSRFRSLFYWPALISLVPDNKEEDVE